MKPWSIDPLKYCHFYKKYGCSHVDGDYCNVSTCSILEEYNKNFLRIRKLEKIIVKINEKCKV